jgi:cell division protein FtsI (penicillin-binding protein 3)
MSDRFFCSGSLTDRRLGKTIHCVLHGPDERNGHGWQTVREVLRKSCNVATAQIALRLRSNHLYAAIRRAGLVERRLLGLPGEHRGTLAKRDGMDDTSSSTVARVGFGQSIEVTPIAMAAMYAAIANGGVWTAPHLLKAWLNEDGTTQQPAPPARMRIASPTIAAQVRDCLQYVAESPGLKVVQIPGYTVAGKTGTAQKRAYGGKGYAVDKRIASFIGFVPATNPKVVVCVVVDEPHNGRFGAEVAAPVFRKIAEEVMLYLKTPHDATVTQKSLRTASNG